MAVHVEGGGVGAGVGVVTGAGVGVVTGAGVGVVTGASPQAVLAPSTVVTTLGGTQSEQVDAPVESEY